MRSVEAVVQLVDRKPTGVVRMTFDILVFDHAGCFDTETFERHQLSSLELHMTAERYPLGAKDDAEADANIIDASAQFSARGGRWVPPSRLGRRTM